MSEYDKLLSYLNSLDEPVKIKNPQKRKVIDKNIIESSEDFNLSGIIIPENFQKNYFENFHIDPIIFPKLLETFEEYKIEPTIDKDELIRCIRNLYYQKHNDYPDYKEDKQEIQIYIGNNIIGFIDCKYNNSINIKNDIEVNTMYMIIEIEISEKEIDDIYFIDFYNIGNIYSYLLNKYSIYNILFTNVIFYIKNLNRFVKFNKKNNINKIEKYFRNIVELQKCLKDNKIPEILNSNRHQCSVCKYETFCKKDSLNKILKDNNDKPTFLM